MRYIWCVAFLVALCGGALATTYYISASGNNANSGLSWAQAKRTPVNLNNFMSPGDTVFLGTGIYYCDTFNLVFDTNTVIACSSFADTNMSGKYHFVELRNGYPCSTGWVNVTGDIYRYHWTRSSITASNAGRLFQGDSTLYFETTAGDTLSLSQGFFYASGNYIYAHFFNLGEGKNPNNFSSAQRPQYCPPVDPLILADDNYSSGRTMVRRVKIYGLYMRYGSPHVIRFDNDIGQPLYSRGFSLVKCKLANAGSENYSGGNNSGVIGLLHLTMDTLYYVDSFVVKSCSIGNAYPDGNAVSNPYGLSNHGSGVSFYKARWSTVDSCIFYGKFNFGCVSYKGHSRYSTVKNCLFRPVEADAAIFITACWFDSFYFNTIYDLGNSTNNILGGAFAFEVYGTGADSSGPNWILFNTIYMNDNNGIVIDQTMQVGSGSYTYADTFKYNVLYCNMNSVPYGIGTYRISDSLGLGRATCIDSNLYILSTVADSAFKVVTETRRSFNYWRTNYGFDINTKRYFSLDSAHFVNPPSDLHRNIEGTEVNNIVIGGVVCTKYGAYQDAQTQKKKFLRMLAR